MMMILLMLMFAGVAGFPQSQRRPLSCTENCAISKQIANIYYISNPHKQFATRSNVFQETNDVIKQRRIAISKTSRNSGNNFLLPWDNHRDEGIEGRLSEDDNGGDGDGGNQIGIYRKRKVSPSRSFLDRIDRNDLLQVVEIEKLFTPTKLDRDHIIGSTLSRGFVGFILSVEGTLVDVKKLYEECYRALIKQITARQRDQSVVHNRQSERQYDETLFPSKQAIHDIIGLPFRDACVELQIGIPKHALVDGEREFYALMHRILDNWFDYSPHLIEAQKGAVSFVQSLLRDRNELAIQSNLPIDIAQRLLSHTGLATILEDNNVPVDHFVPYPFAPQSEGDSDSFDDTWKGYNEGILTHAKRPHHKQPTRDNEVDDEEGQYEEMLQNFYAPTHGERFQMNQYLRCCAKMQSIPSMTLLVDGNRKNIVTAKRVGIPCVAVKGNSMNSQLLRGADIIIDDLTHLNMHHSYQIVKRAMKEASGPETQIDTPPLQIKRSHRYELELLEPGDKRESVILPERPELYHRPTSFLAPQIGNDNKDDA